MIRMLLDSAEHAHQEQERRRKLILRSLEETYGYKEPNEPEASTSKVAMDETQRQDEALRIRTESIGFKVGWTLAER